LEIKEIIQKMFFRKVSEERNQQRIYRCAVKIEKTFSEIGYAIRIIMYNSRIENQKESDPINQNNG
jgi:hypothetical protein